MNAPDDTTPEDDCLWFVRADDGRRSELPRTEDRACSSVEALRAAVRDARASFAGEPGARVELWARAQCGDLHLEVVWVWEHGAEGRWSMLASANGAFLVALLLGGPDAPAAAAASEDPLS